MIIHTTLEDLTKHIKYCWLHSGTRFGEKLRADVYMFLCLLWCLCIEIAIIIYSTHLQTLNNDRLEKFDIISAF